MTKVRIETHFKNPLHCSCAAHRSEAAKADSRERGETALPLCLPLSGSHIPPTPQEMHFHC